MDDVTSTVASLKSSIAVLEQKVKYLQDYVIRASPPEGSVYLSELQAKLDKIDQQQAVANKAK